VSESEALLTFALELADASDRIAMKHFRGDLQIQTKPDQSLVTRADTEIERHLRDRIASAFPSHAVLGEEFGKDSGSAESRWIIDPIDATANYARGVPVFATLLAYERAGELLLGIISAPGLGQRWHALRGHGAWNGTRRLHVSQIGDLARSQVFYASRTAFIAVGQEKQFDAVVGSTWRDRGFGDFWGYALVAEGTGEAMFEPELYPWDLAAPLVLIEEAGGRVSDFQGRRSYQGPTALATNGLVHEAILEKLNRTAS
jgi:histidinol-phosphatase